MCVLPVRKKIKYEVVDSGWSCSPQTSAAVIACCVKIEPSLGAGHAEK